MSEAISVAETRPRIAAFAARSTLLALAWPIFIEQALRVLIGTVDTLMVSHIGDARSPG